jgi:membrane protein
MRLKFTAQLFHDAGRQFAADRALSLAAAVSFYTLLSFAPLMVLTVWISSSLGAAEQESVLRQIGLLAGEEAREAAQAVMRNAQQHPSLGSLAGVGGIAISLFAATTVFAQLQTALNAIWGIRSEPGKAIWHWLRRRVLSVGIIAAILFVLMVSLAVSAAIGVLLEQTGLPWDLLNTLVTAVIFTVLFSLMFRYLPDARLPHRYAWQGGAVTAVLFMVGKALIGIYLGSGEVGGAYGAAAFLVVLLLWVYYASAIFFYGAEFVQASVSAKGEHIPLAENAERVSKGLGEMENRRIPEAS